MELLFASVAVLIASGVVALFLHAAPGLCSRVGAAGVAVGAALAGGPVWRVLASGVPIAAETYPWAVPGGTFAVGLDLLSAWFLLLVYIVPTLAAVFGVEFLKAYAPRK